MQIAKSYKFFEIYLASIAGWFIPFIKFTIFSSY